MKNLLMLSILTMLLASCSYKATFTMEEEKKEPKAPEAFEKVLKQEIKNVA